MSSILGPLSRISSEVLYLCIGGVGTVVLSTIVYRVYKRKRDRKETKTYPFKEIKPPTQVDNGEDKRTVAILGSTGFVGSHLVDHFIENGQHRVYMLGRRFSEEKIHPKADAVFQVDMLNPDSLVSAFEGVDTVIHTAISIPTVYSKAEDIRRLNITGAQNILNAAKRAGVKNFIFISGIKFAQEHKNAETRALVNAFEYIEELVTQANRNSNMRTCVLAFSQIYGVRNTYYEALMRGDLRHFPLLDNYSSYLPVEYVADAVFKAEQKLLEGDNLVAGNILNITGVPSSIREFFSHPSWGVKVKHLPVFLLNLMAKINSLVANTIGYAPFGEEMSSAICAFLQNDEERYDFRISQEALGIEEVPPLDVGIPRMVQKFRQLENERERRRIQSAQ